METLSLCRRKVFGALLLALTLTSSAQPLALPAANAIKAELTRLAAAPNQGAHGLAERLYAEGGYVPVWSGKSAEQARLAISLLQSADQHGLSPAHYQADALAARLNSLTPAQAARFEIDLSAAVLQLLADLHAGRVKPDYPVAQGDVPAVPFDPVDRLRQALKTHRLKDAVEEAPPQLPLYRRVKATLAQYRQLARAPGQTLAIPPLPKGSKLVTGSSYPGIADLRARLALLGDLAAGAPAANDTVYTSDLADAVKRFQSRHGLEEDGKLGPATMAALMVPLSQRVRQLELTLERLRWLPPFRPGRVVVVNLPAYRLWAFDTAGAAAAAPLEMRVIVGTAVKTPTPLFIGTMRYLEFNPYWNVPRSIELGEIIPKLTRNPAYLEQNDMELIAKAGQMDVADAAAAIAALEAGTVRVRQRPGPRNALGAVKFAMPNPMSIYLHSTSARELFNKTRRDLSHGCIRVERPAELAQFVLADPLQWDADKVQAAMQPGPAKTVRLKEPVPVVLFYATALTDRKGRALFSEDIYRRDAKLLAALQQP